MIASIPILESADLWMNIQSDCRERYRDNDERQQMMNLQSGKCEVQDQSQELFLSSNSAVELFTYMEKKKHRRALQEVTFQVGDFTRLWIGLSLRKRMLN